MRWPDEFSPVERKDPRWVSITAYVLGVLGLLLVGVGIGIALMWS